MEKTTAAAAGGSFVFGRQEVVVQEVEEEEEKMELPAGFRFHPTDEELISYYLYPKVLNTNFTTRAIGDVDLNKCEPWELPKMAKLGSKEELYFFCVRDRKYPTGMRTNRATESGYWKATGKDKEIMRTNHNNNNNNTKKSSSSSLVGMKKTLVFYKGRAPKGEKSNWVMHEFRLEGILSPQYLPSSSKTEWVICRVFEKNNNNNNTTKKNFPENDHHQLMLSMDEDDDTSSFEFNLPPLTDPSSSSASPPPPSSYYNNNNNNQYVSCFSNNQNQHNYHYPIHAHDIYNNNSNFTNMMMTNSNNHNHNSYYPFISHPKQYNYPIRGTTTASSQYYNNNNGDYPMTTSAGGSQGGVTAAMSLDNREISNNREISSTSFQMTSRDGGSSTEYRFHHQDDNEGPSTSDCGYGGGSVGLIDDIDSFWSY